MTSRTPVDLADRLLDIRRIYLEPGIEEFARARDVLNRFPDAEHIEVLSHQAIPGLHGACRALLERPCVAKGSNAINRGLPPP